MPSNIEKRRNNAKFCDVKSMVLKIGMIYFSNFIIRAKNEISNTGSSFEGEFSLEYYLYAKYQQIKRTTNFAVVSFKPKISILERHKILEYEKRARNNIYRF